MRLDMSTPDFAQYLRDRGLISDALLLEVRTVATEGRIPLGRLLLESQAMNVRQVMKVLALQAEAPGLRFGELSIREGYITTAQLEAALVRQSTARRHQIDVLRDMRLMTHSEFEALLMDYVGFLELRIAEDEGVVAA